MDSNKTFCTVKSSFSFFSSTLQSVRVSGVQIALPSHIIIAALFFCVRLVGSCSSITTVGAAALTSSVYCHKSLRQKLISVTKAINVQHKETEKAEGDTVRDREGERECHRSIVVHADLLLLWGYNRARWSRLPVSGNPALSQNGSCHLLCKLGIGQSGRKIIKIIIIIIISLTLPELAEEEGEGSIPKRKTSAKAI